MSHGTGGTVTPGVRGKTAEQFVSIHATPANGYSFTIWTGSGTGSYSGTNNPASITMGGPITETATFIPYTLIACTNYCGSCVFAVHQMLRGD